MRINKKKTIRDLRGSAGKVIVKGDINAPVFSTVRGLWCNRKDLPDFASLRKEFDARLKYIKIESKKT